MSKNIVKIVFFNGKDPYSIISQEAKEKEIILTPETHYDEISNVDDGNTLRDIHIVTGTLINASVKTQIDGFHELEKKNKKKKQTQRHISKTQRNL